MRLLMRAVASCLAIVLFISVCTIQKSLFRERLKSCGTVNWPEKNVAMDDECLIENFLKERVSNPSTEPYNLTSWLFDNKSDPLHAYIADSRSPWVEALLLTEAMAPKRERRNFLECGALDGVIFANTLYMERHLNWTGVLIEADPIYYDQLRRRNRKAYAVNACASTTPFPFTTLFRHAKETAWLSDSTGNRTEFNPSVGHIVQPGGNKVEPQQVKDSFEVEVLCIPIYTMLLALKKTTIDVFVLDIEGHELQVLKTIPFEKVDISVIVVEMNGGLPRCQETISFLKSVGYSFHGYFQGGMHPLDGIFVKSDIYQPQKLKDMPVLDAYKIITGERGTQITQERLKLFEQHFSFTSQLFGIDGQVCALWDP